MDVMVERSQSRVTVPLTVVLDYASGTREVRLSDLSLGGCYVDSISGVRPEEFLRLKLSLPQGRSVEMSGTVVYVHEGIGFGVQFNDMTREQRNVIEQLILVNGGTI
jgi:PilZ domain